MDFLINLVVACLAGFGVSFILIGTVGISMGDGFFVAFTDGMYSNMFTGFGIVCTLGALMGMYSD